MPYSQVPPKPRQCHFYSLISCMHSVPATLPIPPTIPLPGSLTVAPKRPSPGFLGIPSPLHPVHFCQTTFPKAELMVSSVPRPLMAPRYLLIKGPTPPDGSQSSDLQLSTRAPPTMLSQRQTELSSLVACVTRSPTRAFCLRPKTMLHSVSSTSPPARPPGACVSLLYSSGLVTFSPEMFAPYGHSRR